MQYYYHEQLTDLDDTGFGVIYVQKSNAYVPAHWHQAVELLLFEKGSVTCKFNHSSMVTKPNEVYLINSHDVHETFSSHDASYLCVHILPSAMCKYVPNFDQLSFSLKFDADDDRKAAAFNQLRIHLQEILRNKKGELEASELEIHGRLFALAAILVKYFSQTIVMEEAVLQRSDMSRLEPLLEFTRLHHAENLTLDDAATLMGLNREYFCRLFKKNMGISYLSYLNQIRATAVCRELEISEDPISMIGERHGFLNPKILNQYFRGLFGCTPSEKRKAFREMLNDG